MPPKFQQVELTYHQAQAIAYLGDEGGDLCGTLGRTVQMMIDARYPILDLRKGADQPRPKGCLLVVLHPKTRDGILKAIPTKWGRQMAQRVIEK